MSIKKILAAALSMLCLFMSGCGKTEMKVVEPVYIPAIFLIDSDTGIAENKDFIERFNEAYAGQYVLSVEWMTGTPEAYRERLKQLNAIDKLPAVITDIGVDEVFYKMLVNHDRLVDIAPYMDETWQQMIQPDMLEACTEENGAIYRSPIAAPTYSYSGIIYSRKLLKDAGYEQFPKTWDEFFECLEALRENGITPLSLQGRDTYWTSMLLSTAYCAKDEAGRSFLKQQFPTNYEVEPMREMMTFFKKIYQYTYEDVLETDYGTARERLLSGETAMIANGYWMFDTLSSSEEKAFGFAAFPGDILMASPKMTAWAVTSGYDEAVIRGAVEVMRFRAQESRINSQKFMAMPSTPIVNDYKTAISEAAYVIPNYQLQWEQEIQYDFFDEYFPKYLEGTVSQEDLLKKMSERARSILFAR